MAISARQVIGEYQSALARLAAGYERDPARREELLEEIFLAIASSMPRRRGASQLKPFVFRVAHNRATRFVQRAVRGPETCDALVREPGLFDEIRNLSLPYRQAIMLLHEDFSASEIAEVLCIPLARARSLIELGNRQFAMKLDDRREIWRGQPIEVRAPRGGLRLRSGWSRIWLTGVLGLAAAGIAAGVWHAYSAWLSASLSSGKSAVVLLMTAPPLAIVAFLARKENLNWARESPESVLVCGRYRAEASLRAIRLGRGYVCIFGSHIAILWISELGGLISAREFLEFYSVAWAATAVAFLPWLSFRERRVYEELAIADQLLGEVTSA